MSQQLEQMIQIETVEVCSACDGTGRLKDYYSTDTYTCPTCHGTGRIVTVQKILSRCITTLLGYEAAK